MKIDVGKIALVAVMIAGIQVNVLYHRIDDLECQRDIYKSRYEDWEGVSKEIAEYADTLRDSLKARDRLDGKARAHLRNGNRNHVQRCTGRS